MVDQASLSPPDVLVVYFCDKHGIELGAGWVNGRICCAHCLRPARRLVYTNTETI